MKTTKITGTIICAGKLKDNNGDDVSGVLIEADLNGKAVPFYKSVAIVAVNSEPDRGAGRRDRMQLGIFQKTNQTMNTYEINNRNEVIPYTSGRKCTDTRAWRDATELELQQKDEIESLESELTKANEYADKLAAGLPDGMLPKDVEVLREANLGLAVELTAVTEQRDEALSDLEFRRDLYNLQTKQLINVREQRDRLAKALKKLTKYDLGDIPIGIVRECKEALQSLNKPTEQ